MDAADGVCCAAPPAAKSAPTATSAPRTSPRFMFVPSLRSCRAGSVRQTVNDLTCFIKEFKFRRSISRLALLLARRSRSLPPSERLAPLAPEHAAREDFQPPGVQPNGGERIRSRAIPPRNDCRVVPDRLGPIEKKVPHHDPRLVIESPRHPAFCDTGVMRGRPVVQRNVRARVKVGALEGGRAGSYPADETRAIPLPVGV